MRGRSTAGRAGQGSLDVAVRPAGGRAHCRKRVIVVGRVLSTLKAAHEGSVGVLLADGTEPGPVHYDVGSGARMPSTTEWHAYDGRFSRTKAR